MLRQELTQLHYKDQPIIRMMNKLRSCQQVGSPLYNKGAVNECRAVYLSTVKEMMDTPKFQEHIPVKILPLLKSANDLSTRNAVSLRNSTFMLRRAIDILYDHFMDQYCNKVDMYQQRMSMQDVREKLKEAITLYEQENYEESLQVYEQIAKDILRMDVGLPAKNLNSIKECLLTAKSASTSKDAASIMHDCALRLYDESRLPEVHVGSQISIAIAMEEVVTNHHNQREEVILNFQHANQLEAWEVYMSGDSVIGGESTYTYTPPSSGHKYGNFGGQMSLVNEGGFAILNMKPKSSDFVFHINQKLLGFRVKLRNSCVNNEHYSFLFYNAENKGEYRVNGFCWRADFIAHHSEDFNEVFISISSFWPNIFGHSLGYPGQMKYGKVDAFALSIGRNCDNGKVNPGFNVGQYSLDIQSFAAVMSHDASDHQNGDCNGNSNH